MGTVDLVVQATRLGALLSEAAHWADRITLCLSAPSSEHGNVAAWAQLLEEQHKYERAIVNQATHSEPWLLHRLHETGALRLLSSAEQRFAGNLLWFEREGAVRILVVPVSLTRSAVRVDCGASVHFAGCQSDDFAVSAQQRIAQWRELCRVPTGSELDQLASLVRHQARLSMAPAPAAQNLTVLSEAGEIERSVHGLVAQLPWGLRGAATTASPGLPGSPGLPAPGLPAPGGVASWTTPEGLSLSLHRRPDGFELDLIESEGREPFRLALRTGRAITSGNALLLCDTGGKHTLAWRGGLLGSTPKKNQMLWSQCEVPTVELRDPSLEGPERVAVVAVVGPDAADQLSTFLREVRRLEVLFAAGRRRRAGPGISDFASLDEKTQTDRIWGNLIGLGALPLDEAVELAARGLRDDGYVEYQRLRRDGPLFALLRGAIEREAARGESFDRAESGQVRAIQPRLRDFTREDWLDCVLNAVPEGQVLDRSTVLRLLFDCARHNWGLAAQRLRSGGKTEKALKSTINSAVRRGLLRRVGAAYLAKVETGETAAEPGPPPPACDAVEARGFGSSSPARAPSSFPKQSEADTAAEAATAAEAKPTAEATAAAQDPLARPLHDLALPARASNWADRQGLRTLRELVAWHPDAFLREPNLGRLTVAETRVAVESALGREWEEVWSELGGPKREPPSVADPELRCDSSPLPSPEPCPWDRRLAELPAAHHGLPLGRLALPGRMRSFCEARELSSVAALLCVSRQELLAQPNLGRASLSATLEALEAALLDLDEATSEEDLLASWRSALGRLTPVQRMVLLHRSGTHGPRETLEELGETLGLTRERVRQIEVQCLDDLRRRSDLVQNLHDRLERAFAGGRCIPLALLIDDDRWWRGIEQHAGLADYLFERLLGGNVHRLELDQGGTSTTFFARFTQQTLQAAQSRLLEQAAAIATPAPLSDYQALLDSAVERLDPALREALQAALDEQLNFDERDAARVVSFGSKKGDQAIALLASQPEPVPVARVFDAVGRCQLPGEVLYFRRGLVGLEQHFPDFTRWMEALVPKCIEVMARMPVGRQWMVPELHDALREGGEVPEWLGHWHLASLLRRSGRVDYLGRLRVALQQEGDRRERIRLDEAVREVLDTAGTPLSFQSIAERVRQQTDIRDETLSLMLISSPFVRLDEDRYGLVERDVPGGAEAIARAVDAVVGALAKRERGLTVHQAHALGARSEHGWNVELFTSLLRSEPQLRLSRSGHVGLSSWDDVRAPTRGEFIRQQVEKAGGRLPVAELQRVLLEVYGRALERSELAGDCQRNDLSLQGDFVATRGAPSSSQSLSPQLETEAELETETELSGRVQGIPAAARDHFEALLKEPLRPAEEVLAEARAHLSEIEEASHANEFIDVSLAKTLVERMARLVERVAGLSSTTRRIVHAAILYFTSNEDAEDDFDLGGLEDDEVVLDAVLAHLELE